MCTSTSSASAVADARPPTKKAANLSLQLRIVSHMQDTMHFALFSIICVASFINHHIFTKKRSITVKSLSQYNKKAVYVITGCDSGFGNLLSKELIQQSGVVVVSLCLTLDAVEELKALGIDAIQCDVTSDKDVENVKIHVEKILESRNGVLHSLVNNAGVTDPGDFLWYNDLSTIQRTMDVNFMGQLRVTQAILPMMVRTSPVFGGRIFNMSSVCGANASSGNGAYNASKFAVEGWSDSLRQELAHFNIKVVKIRPGQFSTAIQSNWADCMVNNYLQSSDQVQGLYGGEAHAQYLREVLKGMGGNEGNPSDAVSVLVDLLARDMDINKLKPYYWVGGDAKTFWRAMATIPTAVADSLKKFISFKPMPRKVPPSGVVSHVTISVKSIQRSSLFYQAFGLKPLGETKHGQQFLSSGSSNSKWNTLVLLKEDPMMESPRGKSYEAGMTRLCIYTANHDEDVKRLIADGLAPIAPTAVDKNGGILLTAFADPDGFVVYLIQLKGLAGVFLRLMLWKRKQQSPSLFHWTINVTSSIGEVMKGFEQLGFKTISNQTSDQVKNDLLPAFNIDPKTCEIEHIRICHQPDDNFCATLMQWVNPKSEKKGWELTNSMTLSVDDVGYTLELAREAGFETKAPEERVMPVFGRLMVGQIFVEPGSAPIEVCCYA